MGANPQLKDGYTRIANELMEAFAATFLTISEFKTLFAFLRKTYGWRDPKTGRSKKADRISITQFQKMTKLSRQSQVNALKGLVKKDLLVVQPSGLGNTYSLQKDWLKYPSQSSWTGSQTSHKKVVKPLGHTKDTLTKDTLNKNPLDKPKVGKKKKVSKREKTSFPKETYNRLIAEYQRLKGIELRGNEFKPIQQAIKTMFLSKRTPEDILRCMKWFAQSKATWTAGWTMNTVRLKMAEFLASKLPDVSGEPFYKDCWKCKGQGHWFSTLDDGTRHRHACDLCRGTGKIRR